MEIGAVKETISRGDLYQYCCIPLLKAVANGYLHEVVSGIYLLPKNESGCCEGTPKIEICPFCGAICESRQVGGSWEFNFTQKGNKGE